jgi:DNA polymerase-3 subunit epsilon
MNKIAFFDLETTGTSVSNSKIVQIGVLITDLNLREISRHEWLVNPLIPIPKEASDIHGITNEKVKDAKVFEWIAEEFLATIAECHLAGYNILGFDIPLLNEELLRCGKKLNMERRKVFDVMQMYFDLNPRKLENAYFQYTGKKMDNAHDALADVIATKDVLVGMVRKEKKMADAGGYINYSDSINPIATMVDYSGCFVRNLETKSIHFAFGKNKGMNVKDDLKYLHWIIERGDFPMDTKLWAKRLYEHYSKKR